MKTVKELLGEQDLVIADVGAAYGLPAHLRVLEPVATVCLFEPHPERAKELHSGGRRRVFPVALSGSGGPRTLYVTNVPTGSSLLKPGSEAALERGDPDYFFPVREVQVQTRRLGEVLAEEGLQRLDFIKLDIQGAELEVLQGIGGDTLLGVELEIGFPGGYLGQPSFAEINRHLESLGLELFDLKPVRGHRHHAGAGYAEEVFGVDAAAPSLAQRLWEADAVYFRPAKALIAARDGKAIRRLAVLHCAYGFFVEAHHTVGRAAAAGLFTPEEADALRRGIVTWHRRARYLFTDSPRVQRWLRAAARLALRLRLPRRRFAGWLDF